jgi:hypothetical protein
MDDQTHISLLKKKLMRAELIRKESERLLETKSRELFEAKRLIELSANKLQLQADIDAELQAYQTKMEALLLECGRLFLQQAPSKETLQNLVNRLTDQIVISCVLSIDGMKDINLNGTYLSGHCVSWHGEPSGLRLQNKEHQVPIKIDEYHFGHMRFLINSKTQWLATICNQLVLLSEMISAALGRQQTLAHAISARNRAEESEKASRDFLAMINHELRTPLHGVLGSAELLSQTELNRDQLDLLHSLNQSGEVLRTIINDLLDYSKMNAGMLELTIKAFSTATLVKELSALFQLRANEKQILYKVILKPDLPQTFLGDVERIKQILSNLISNAMKFTFEGFVTVTLSWVDRTLWFEVKDSGCGIPDHQLNKLFKPFSQVDSSSQRRHEGTGLGLVISKTLAEQMSGKISLSSQLNKGTTFWVELPLHVSDKVVESDGNAQNRTRTLGSMTVLIAEDIKTNQMIIGLMLKRMGVKYEIVDNGELAVARLLDMSFDVVLMDCRMPIMDGYQATQQLRQNDYTKPIIALTAGTSKSERQACMDSGMDDIVCKPYKYEDIYECLLKWRPEVTQKN